MSVDRNACIGPDAPAKKDLFFKSRSCPARGFETRSAHTILWRRYFSSFGCYRSFMHGYPDLKYLRPSCASGESENFCEIVRSPGSCSHRTTMMTGCPSSCALFSHGEDGSHLPKTPLPAAVAVAPHQDTSVLLMWVRTKACESDRVRRMSKNPSFSSPVPGRVTLSIKKLLREVVLRT